MRSKIVLVNALVIFSLTSCATREVKLTHSGFLSGYSDLKEENASGGMRVYRNPGVDIGKRYSKILMAPVRFKLDPAVKVRKIKNEDLDELADYFYQKLKIGLEKSYRIVDEPSDDVLLFRGAITDILPNRVYLNLHWMTTLYGAGIGGASLEAEFVDSLTGERMISFVDARKGKKINYTKGLTKWGHTKEVLGGWADVIVANLKQLKEKYQVKE